MLVFLSLFFGELLSWAGIPAIGTASAAAAGALASQGQVELWAVLVIGTIGAELGAMLGWWIGFRITGSERRSVAAGQAGVAADHSGQATGKPMRREKAMQSGERIMERWGPLVVFVVPSWVSGALGMRFRRFALWSLIPCTLLNAGAALSAYGIGSAASGKATPHILIPLLTGVLCLGAIVMLLLFLHKRRLRRRARRAAAASTAVR
jgi:membrane protein DedA with SNARE-associated domain